MKLIKLFLRLGIAVGFLSAVADRFGMWPAEISAWGNMDNFLAYTQVINPLLPESLIPALGWWILRHIQRDPHRRCAGAKYL